MQVCGREMGEEEDLNGSNAAKKGRTGYRKVDMTILPYRAATGAMSGSGSMSAAYITTKGHADVPGCRESERGSHTRIGMAGTRVPAEGGCPARG